MRAPTVILIFLCTQLLPEVAVFFAPTSAYSQSTSDDFKLVARYGPGYSTWRGWTCTITNDGKALQNVVYGGRGGGEPYDKTFMLPKDAVVLVQPEMEEAPVRVSE
jgi:hypothetical protein